MEIGGTKESCTCDKCKSACQYKPGWFMPGEAEKLALHLGITVQDLFDTKLAVDWWVDDPDVFLLSPAIISGEIGTEFPADPRGECIFFEKGLCKIHPVKPFECREGFHEGDQSGRHQQVADAWRSHQEQIERLLDRQPQSQNFSLFDSLLGGLV